MTTHTTVTPYQLAAPDVRTALTLYQYLFIDAMGKYQNPQCYMLGTKDTSSALLTKYPMTIGDPVFEKMVAGASSYKELGEIFLSFVTDIYASGVKSLATVLRTSEWARRGWAMQPMKHAAALPLMYERLIAAAMMAGTASPSPENIDGTSAIKFFQVGHPCDPLGGNAQTYDNLFTGAASGAYPGALPLNAASIATVRQVFRTQKGQNGVDYRGTELTHVVVGPDLEETALTQFKEENILVPSGNTGATVLRPNPQKKYKPVQVVVNPYLTTAGDWYPCSSDIIGELPWISLTKVPADSGRVAGMPGPALVGADGLEWIFDDETSELYKHGNVIGPKGTVAVACQVEAGAALTTPWSILCCKAT